MLCRSCREPADAITAGTVIEAAATSVYISLVYLQDSDGAELLKAASTAPAFPGLLGTASPTSHSAGPTTT